MKLDDIIQQPGQMERMQQETSMSRINVARPGTVVKYNETEKTVDVQLAVRNLGDDGLPPILNGVPVVFIGSYTFDVKKGDECLVVFADNNTDAWWQNGKVVSPLTARKHDLSDGFAFIGVHSSPNVSKGSKLEDVIAEIQSNGLKLYINEDGQLIFEKASRSVYIDENGCVVYTEASADIDFYLDSNGYLWMED